MHPEDEYHDDFWAQETILQAAEAAALEAEAQAKQHQAAEAVILAAETQAEEAKQREAAAEADMEGLPDLPDGSYVPPVIDTTVVYYPPHLHGKTDGMSADQLKSATWITDELVQQIKDLAPRRMHVGTNQSRDKLALARHAEIMFPPGRIFASTKQLDECAKLFGKMWGFVATNTNKKMCCAVGRSTGGKVTKKETLKDKVDCKFELRYSLVKYTAEARREGGVPLLRFQCKITTCAYWHDCPCSVSGYIQAQTVAHKSMPKPEVMKFAVELLRRTPHADNKVLRDCLAQYVPRFLYLSATKLGHIRRAITGFLLKHPDGDLCEDELDELERTLESDFRHLQYSEIMQDEIMGNNFTALLREVMQNTSATWKATDFLEQLQKQGWMEQWEW